MKLPLRHGGMTSSGLSLESEARNHLRGGGLLFDNSKALSMTHSSLPAVAAHGATHLPSVDLDSYNVELKDDEGFIGDRASKGAFRDIIENWRATLRQIGDDPFGEDTTEELSKKKLDELLAQGDPEAAGVVQGAIEQFSQDFAVIIRQFLKLKEWKDTQRIAIGGGFRASRVGELVIGRTAVILKADKIDIALVPIHHDPDEAGLMGAVHLAPSWMFKAFDAILGVDIGGTNIRAGVIQLNHKKASDLSKIKVWKFSLWRHGDEEGVKREHAVDSLAEMLKGLIAAAKKKQLNLAPFIGVGCPGVIEPDGSIDRGAQNLPGNWSTKKFNLPATLHAAIPKIGEEDTSILMHNDAVVQGLSEVPFMKDVEHWGVFTIGTGLGNARFSKRATS
jgi:predicted NBD/HSP70 family sugar kinase